MAQSQGVAVISKQEHDNADFKSLYFLKDELKDVKVIGLGESLHIMGATYTSKVKFIKFLHEVCGFNVLAFETPLYDLSIAYGKYIKGELSLKELKKVNSGVWYFKELDELYDYVEQTKNSENPLILTGFDESVFYDDSEKYSETGKYKDYNVVRDYVHFIDSLNTKVTPKIEKHERFIPALAYTARKTYYFAKTPKEDTIVLHNTFSNVREALNNHPNLLKDDYFRFWNMMTSNLEDIYRKNYGKSKRDSIMAENVDYLIKNRYPNEKIILWGANYHLMNDLFKIEKFRNKEYNNPTGYYLKKKLGEKYYSVAFVPYGGVTGQKGLLGLMKSRAKTKKGSLERYIHNAYNDCDYAFISTRQPSVRKEIKDHNITRANVLFDPLKMDVNDVVDAYFYIKEEKVVTPRNK